MTILSNSNSDAASRAHQGPLHSKTRRPQTGPLSAPLVAIIWLATGSLATQLGCRGMLAENMKPPGTIWEQRNRAVQFDPYPIDHMGPPIVGGRPRDYDRPLAEATSNQLVPKTPRW